jgi:membrane protease YdiL (CAAX protease family)
MDEAPWRIVLYALWALVQEILAQSYLYLRLEAVWGGSRRAVLMTAVLFALAHLPNPVLTPVTLVAALAFTAAFRRWRNVYTVAVAHAVLGLALSVTMPAALTHQMRVGIAYWR